MAYIGRQLARGENKLFDDISSSFNGSTTTFNLTVSSVATATATAYQLFVSLGGVMQKPNTDFTTAGNQITFTTAPAAGLSCWIMMQGDTIDQAAIPDASVSPSKIAGSGDFAFPADVRLKDSDGSHYVGFQSAATVSTNIVWTLPAADGSANQILKTNGSGVLSWTTDSSLTLLDEDDFASNSSSSPASQQSVKAYVDAGDVNITVADESSDTTCFPLFVTAATGTLPPKSGTNLTFNSSSGALTATSFVGALTGNVTGNCSGTALSVTQAAQTSITSLGTLTGLTVDGACKQVAEAVGALDIDLSTGNYFTKTISGNSTFTFSNPATSGTVNIFMLELTHSSGTVTWPSEVKWNADTAPTLTTGKTHLFMFVTDDNGSRYRGSALVDYVN